MSSADISYVLPAYNARSVLRRSVSILVEHLPTYGTSEIIIVENGSTDDTWQTAQELVMSSNASAISVRAVRSAKGIGHAFRHGVSQSSGRLVVCTGADVPFGMTDLEALFDRHPLPADGVFVGSKRHPDSDVGARSPLRSMLTAAFAVLRSLMLKATVADTQGSLLMPGGFARRLLPLTREGGYLVTTEMIEIAHRNGVTVVELPVRYPADDRSSTVKPIRDSWNMLVGLRRVACSANQVVADGSLAVGAPEMPAATDKTARHGPRRLGSDVKLSR